MTTLKFITTIINENYWNPWGISWISSLIEFADTKAKIIVIDAGLASKSVKRLIDLGVTVVPSIKAEGFHQSAIETLAKISKDNDKFLFFDVDLWFQLPVDELFDKFDENFLMCDNSNYGFIGISHKNLQKYEMIKSFCLQAHDTNVIGCLLHYFPNFVEKIDNKYNFSDLPKLQNKNGMLVYNDLPQSVLHFHGVLKSCSERKNLLYSERYPDLFSKYCENNKKISTHRIMSNTKKSDVNHNI